MSSRPDNPRRIADLLIQHQQVVGGCACGWTPESNRGSIWQDHAAEVVLDHLGVRPGTLVQLTAERNRAVKLLSIAHRREGDSARTIALLKKKVSELSGQEPSSPDTTRGASVADSLSRNHENGLTHGP